MRILTTTQDLATLRNEWSTKNLRVALVPTMGYFHEGHLSLMRRARGEADKVVVSLFVNPTQFGPGEDLDSYPRNPERDARLAGECGVDVLFQPSPEAMYAPDHATWVEVPSLSGGLCGTSRPTHFRGVCTVVLKLFNLVRPDIAIFGEKDWQQLAVIRTMSRDLNVPVRIVGHPVIRESDGLALSSRNAYLTSDERLQAPGIRKSLEKARILAQDGNDRESILETLKKDLAREVPLGIPDYLEIIHPETLTPLSRTLDGPALLAVAVRLGKARLIDNITLIP